jgi:endogenous inhibitor of DNA gyrase (YacG/DUF329 family)
MAKRKAVPRPRSLERAALRAADKQAEQREKLFLLETGGTPQRPIEVPSPSVVENKAAALTCPTCEVSFRVEAHHARSVAGLRLREAEVSCPRCGKRRSLWFRLVAPAQN